MVNSSLPTIRDGDAPPAAADVAAQPLHAGRAPTAARTDTDHEQDQTLRGARRQCDAPAKDRCGARVFGPANGICGGLGVRAEHDHLGPNAPQASGSG
jgi:hypothetical protein